MGKTFIRYFQQIAFVCIILLLHYVLTTNKQLPKRLEEFYIFFYDQKCIVSDHSYTIILRIVEKV